MVTDNPFALPHGYVTVYLQGIDGGDDAVEDGVSQGTASQPFVPALRYKLGAEDGGELSASVFHKFEEIPLFLVEARIRRNSSSITSTYF